MAGAEWQVRWRERVFSIAAMFVRWPTNWAMGAPILLYHRVVEPGVRTTDPFTVTLDAFANQISWLKERWNLVTMQTLAARLASGNAEGLAAVTFDDGYRCTVTRALSVLRAQGVPATVFVDTGRLNTSSSALRADDVRALSDAGMEIGSHSLTHTDLTHLDDQTLRMELTRSRERLSAITRVDVTGFAYPFGCYNRRVLSAVSESGYQYACTCRQHRTNLPGDDLYKLTRIEINMGDRPRRFAAKLAGRYAPLYRAFYAIDPSRREWLWD